MQIRLNYAKKMIAESKLADKATCDYYESKKGSLVTHLIFQNKNKWFQLAHVDGLINFFYYQSIKSYAKVKLVFKLVFILLLYSLLAYFAVRDEKWLLNLKLTQKVYQQTTIHLN